MRHVRLMSAPPLTRLTVATVATALLAACTPAPAQNVGWWKGNLHTHSLWSDGDEFPETIMDWYKSRGYHFAALSDHNRIAAGDRWIDPVRRVGGHDVLEVYRARFGEDWVEQREDSGRVMVRLKTLDEYRGLFEEVGRFLIIPAEEITSRFETKPIHVNATNIREVIEPRGGSSVRDVMQNNVDAVLEQRERTGQAMFPHINHPNYGWAVTAEDLMALEGERFFEVYNGHPAVNNDGDDLRPSTERMWDIVLAERLSRGQGVMYGIATDDAHNYHEFDDNHSNPGRGWVMVRAEQLSPEAIVAAMEAGDFYGSSGVVLDDVTHVDGRVSLRIRPEEGVTYTTQFIGTRVGYPAPMEIDSVVDGASVAKRYSDEIGTTLAQVPGTSPSYVITGDELYVRAKVISSKPKENPYRQGEVEVAWTQPVVVPR